MRAALYARAHDRKIWAIGIQIGACRKFIAKCGYQQVSYFCDRGETEEKGIAQMLADAAKGDFNVLVVVSPKRLSGNDRRREEIISELESAGVKIMIAEIKA